MKRQFSMALLALALAPVCAMAQFSGTMTTGGSTSPTTSSTTSSPTTSSTTTSQTTTGGGGSTSSGNTTNSTTQQSQVTPVAIKSMTSGTGSGTVSNTGPFVQTYIDPMSAGMPSKFATSLGITKPSGTFGKSLYTASGTAAKGGNSTATQTNVGFNTHGTVRAPAYTTILTSEVPFVAHSSGELLGKVKGTIDRSTWLANRGNIQVSMDGSVVQLHGMVASEKERRVVEGMVRMTPGVSDVVNQLSISGR